MILLNEFLINTVVKNLWITFILKIVKWIKVRIEEIINKWDKKKDYQNSISKNVD